MSSVCHSFDHYFSHKQNQNIDAPLGYWVNLVDKRGQFLKIKLPIGLYSAKRTKKIHTAELDHNCTKKEKTNRETLRDQALSVSQYQPPQKN
jgi:hypothetical protein